MTLSTDSTESSKKYKQLSERAITVIIPVWSKTKPALFKKALDSLLTEANLILETIIVVDDELSDEVNDIFEDDFAKLNIKILKNIYTKGVSGARNTGITHARGDFVAFLDDDDQNLNRRLQKEIQAFLTSDVDIVGSHIQFYDEQGVYIKYRKVALEHTEIIRRANYRSPFNLSTVMVKTSWVKKYNFDENMYKSEDYDLWCRLLAAGAKSKNVDECLALYYQPRRSAHKRLGLEYFLSDITTKTKFQCQFTNRIWPLALILSCITSVHRLLPQRLFNVLYGRSYNE